APRVVAQHEVGIALADAHQADLAQAPGDAERIEHRLSPCPRRAVATPCYPALRWRCRPGPLLRCARRPRVLRPARGNAAVRSGGSPNSDQSPGRRQTTAAAFPGTRTPG